MKRLLEYLPLYFTVWLIIGIIIQFYTQFWQYGFAKLIGLLLIILALFFFIKKKITSIFLSYFLFFFIGISTVYFSNDIHYSSYYKNHIKENSSIILKIEKKLKPNNYYHKYIAKVTQVDTHKTRGRILLNIKKDSVINYLKIDEIIYSKANFSEITPPQNPHQFDYAFYLKKQGIYAQVFLENSRYKSLGVQGMTLKGMASEFRNTLQESLKKQGFKKEELAIMSALLLGQKRDISKELISDYSKAGVIHILAISGLHIGVILSVLIFLFSPLEKLKNGKILKLFLIVLILWMFAFVAGLSASVVRAVTMFTFVAIGESFQQNRVLEFSLISSLFFLLIIYPMFLFDVGFQLSYLAVFGIIWVQPKLYAIWKPTNRIKVKIWKITTVSIAVQVGVLPLSLYYFHQFPGLFMLSNLIILPFLPILLFGGILVLFLSVLHSLPSVFVTIYSGFIHIMNLCIRWISHQEVFLFKDISMSFLYMLSLYAVIFCGINFLMKKSSKELIYFLGTLFFLQVIFLFEKNKRTTKQELIVFHKNRVSVLGKRNGNQFFVYYSFDSLSIKNEYSIKSYRIGENIAPIYRSEIPKFIHFNNKNILIIDSLGVYQIKKQKNLVVILTYNPKINLKRMIKTLSPKEVIVDGSNYKNVVKRWKKTCQELKTPFYYTKEKGAYFFR